MLVSYCVIFGKIIYGDYLIFYCWNCIYVDVLIGKVDVFINFVRNDIDLFVRSNDGCNGF